MILYMSLLLITLICDILNKSTQKKLFIFISIILVLLVGLRGLEIGNDTLNYARVFKGISYLKFENSHMEKGFLLYNFIISKITNEIWIYFLITATITYMGFYFLIIKNSVDIFYSLFLFISLREYTSMMNLVRQELALAMILCSYELIKRNKKKAFIFYVLAVSFHKSAIVFIIIYFFKNIQFKKKYIYLSVFINIFIVLFYRQLLELMFKISIFSKYKNYLNSKYFTSWNPSIIVFTIIYFFILCFYYKYYIKNQKEISIQVNLKMWICFFSFIISFISLVGSIIGRVGIYFSIFYIIIIPDLLFKTKGKGVKKLIVTILCLAYFIIILIYRPEWNYIYPYKFFWSD